jgi:hypothetical protein
MASDPPGGGYNYAVFDGGPAQGDFDAFTGAPHVGTHAPDGSLATLDGDTVTLASLWTGSHLMLEFGSYT